MKEKYCLIPRGMDNYWFGFCNATEPPHECNNCPHHKSNKNKHNQQIFNGQQD